MKPKIIFAKSADVGAGAYYRTILPCLALKKRNYDAMLMPTHHDYIDADIIVYLRVSSEAALLEILHWKKKGKKIVVDYDDNAFSIPLDNPTAHLQDTETKKRRGEILSLADAVTVTVEPLRDVYSKFNDNIHILPNNIDETALNFPTATNNGTKKVGWQGSYTHYDDLKEVRAVLNDLLKIEDFELIIAGFDPKGLFKNKTYRPWIRFSDTLNHYKLFNDLDIGLCPLKKNRFNEGKSDIKFLEYSSLEIPTIASDICTYSEIKNGETGFLARNQGDWKSYINKLLKDEDLRNKLGRASKEYVSSERTIQKNIHLWEALYNNI